MGTCGIENEYVARKTQEGLIRQYQKDRNRLCWLLLAFYHEALLYFGFVGKPVLRG